MTIEEKLAAIIEAQVKGEYQRYKWAAHKYYELTVRADYVYWNECSGFARRTDDSEPFGGSGGAHLLAILLAPEGLRAAYGIKPHDFDGTDEEWNYVGLLDWYVECAKNILRSWLSTPKGNAEGAIETAFSLLPKP